MGEELLGPRAELGKENPVQDPRSSDSSAREDAPTRALVPLFSPSFDPDRPARQDLHPHARHALVLGLLALASVAAGPLLGIASVVVGIFALRQIAAVRRRGVRVRGAWVAGIGIATGALAAVLFCVFAATWARSRHAQGFRPPLEASQLPHPSDPGRMEALPWSSLPEESPPLPKRSSLTVVGSVAVVDVAGGIVSLAKELTDQRTAAAAHGQRLLLEIVTGACEPCRGIHSALGDPKMQKALDRVRLVRVDRDQFEEDLDELEIPTRPWPSFFLLDADLHVRDFITGGEWDEDVAENIAPVLGPFVRGTYTKRRAPWFGAPRPSGTVL